jgi:von Willebrand factor type A domain
MTAEGSPSVARHADAGLDGFPTAPAATGRRGGNARVLAIAAGAVAVVVLVGACLPFVLPSVATGVRSKLPWFPPPACAGTTVIDVVSAPLVTEAVTSLTAGLNGHRMDDGSCLSVRVRQQTPTDTVASSIVLPPARAPQLWVSDSSLWMARVTKWKERAVASFASTPVVLVSSGRAVTDHKWADAKVTWTDLLGQARPLAVPDVANQAEGQLALIALWQSAGKGTAADRAVAAATLAANRTSYASVDDALSSVVNPGNVSDADAPFVVSTEQAMVAINRDSARQVLTPIYPSDGSPSLDFPIVRLAEDQQDTDHRVGTDLVVAALTGAQARAAAHDLGLRDAQGGDPPTSQRGLPEKIARTPMPSESDLTRFLARWTALAAPSRILIATDVSVSMRTQVPGSGLTRLQLAGQAAAAVGDLLPDTSSAGLWIFALNLDGTRAYRELAPVGPLGTQEGNGTHRTALQQQLRGLGQFLTAGGTGLYATALAAVAAQRSTFDPRASNTVVMFTDGTNENDPRITLQQATATLQQQAAAAPDKPVRLVVIGLGPTVDLPSLQTLAQATGGAAYQAETAGQLQAILYDAIARRS